MDDFLGKEVSMYSKPKILLLDVEPSVTSLLGEQWSDIVTGTLGTPYKVPKDSSFSPVIQHNELKGHEEAEIVVVDLAIRKTDDGSRGEPHRPRGEPDLWAKADLGVIDNRVRTILDEKVVFQRILDQGGVYILFSARKSASEVVIGEIYAGSLNVSEHLDFDVWGINSDLQDMKVKPDAGQTMRVVGSSVVGNVLSKHLKGSCFDCTLVGAYRKESPWEVLAVNKFEQPVALMRSRGRRGTTIVVPQLADKASFVKDLMEVALPELAPHLFPDVEQARWKHRPEYELPQVTALLAKRFAIEQKTQVEIGKIDAAIEEERSNNGWLHDLVSGTGDLLVEAVKKALQVVGFTNVVDVDEQRDREGKSRREDLRVEDASPLLVVDIKGIGGYPSDDDATQANKHAFINMKEINRTDVKGLAIINHQRNIPPLDRENRMPFRQEILDVAGETGLGLLTAFDLYRIAVNSKKNKWPDCKVKSLFYGDGRIDVVPSHYAYLGKIAKVMTGKFGVVIEANAVSVGGKIAIEGDIYFEEEQVSSIQIDGASVKSAGVEDRAGFIWSSTAMKLREGMRVFAVTN